MSWGYFLDLHLTLPTADWTRIAETRVGDHPLAASWWGFEEAALGEMFTGADFDDMTIGDAVALFARVESIGTVNVMGSETELRLCQLVDRGGDPSIAKPIAVLVDAAQSTAQGTLRMVNDGSYSGEGGVEITASGGALSRKAIEDFMPFVMKLGAEIYGAEIDEDAEGGEEGESQAEEEEVTQR